jgi:hypothetical protein
VRAEFDCDALSRETCDLYETLVSAHAG